MSIRGRHHFDDHAQRYYLDEHGERIHESVCLCAAYSASECACDCTGWHEEYSEPTHQWIQALDEFTEHIRSLSDNDVDLGDIRAVSIYFNDKLLELPVGWVTEDMQLFLNELCLTYDPDVDKFSGTIWYRDIIAWSEHRTDEAGTYWKFITMPEIES